MDKKIEKKKWPPKKIATYGGGGLFVLVVLYMFIFGDHSSKLNVEAERLTISTVKYEPFQEFIPVTGEIMPIETYYLDVAKGGRVVEKFVEEGAFVKKDQPILRLENPDIIVNSMYTENSFYSQMNALRTTRLTMEQYKLSLKGQLMKINLDLTNQKRIYEKDKKLYEKGLISELEFNESEDYYEYLVNYRELTMESNRQDSLFRLQQIEQLEMNLERAKENLAIIKGQADNLTVKAPIDGQLTALEAEIGQSINQGQNLGRIDDINNYKVRVQIDEHYLPKIQKGLIGEFPFDGKDYKVIVKTVFVQVTNGRFEVDCLFLDEVPEKIRRGQTVRIKLQLGDLSDAMTVARGGFYQSTGGQWAFVVDESGEFAIKRNITLGRYNTQVFEVLEGLKEGDKVITSSYDNYGDVEKLVFK